MIKNCSIFVALISMLVVGVALNAFAGGKSKKSPFVGTYNCTAEKVDYPNEYILGFDSISVLKIHSDYTLESDWYSFTDLADPLDDIENQGTDYATWEDDADQPSLIVWTQETITSEPVDTTITTKHKCLGQGKKGRRGYMKLKCVELQKFDYTGPDSPYFEDYSFTFDSTCER